MADKQVTNPEPQTLTYSDGFRFGVGFMIAAILGSAILSLLSFALFLLVRILT